MDFAMVEAFVAVVESGGFTRAATRLHLSQPALSRRIALLEHELGQAVFERGRSGARLTDAGDAFLPHAQAALACVRDGTAAVRALAKGDAGRLTLAIVGTLASSALTARLARFRAARPALRLLLRTGSSVEVSALVRRGEATIGLRYSADPATDLVSREIDHEPLIVVAPPSHRMASVKRIAARRLAGESWVGFPVRRGNVLDPFGHVLAQKLAATGLTTSELVVIDSLTAQKRLVEGGFGIALVPETSVREEIARGTLVTLDVPELRAQVDVALVHRRGAFLSPAAQRLIDELARVDPEPVGTPRRAMVSRRRVR
jgi:DNA-binding transcriptional LysR family regulator